MNAGVGNYESLEDAFRGVEAADYSLVVVNLTEPEPFHRLLRGAFESQSVEVTRREDTGEDDDRVLLVEDEEVVAASPFETVANSFLLVNSDLYRTGLSGVEKNAPPEVLTALDDQVFRLRGYPESNKEKLLLIVISRYIENRALEAGAGTLRSSFQRLSRVDDESGTRRVYERLADSAVDTHVYGVGEWPLDDLDVEVHSGTGGEYRRSWFVVFSPEGDTDVGPAALVALEIGDNEWKGTWTHDPAKVAAVEEYISREL